MKVLGQKTIMPPRGRALKELDRKDLDDVFIHILPGGLASDIAIDGTGLSIAGPGLYRSQRGKAGGTDRQVSLYARDVVLTDLATGQCLAVAVGTSDRYSEDELAWVLLKEYLPTRASGSLKRFSGDGLYDKAAYYQPILTHSPACSISIPPAVNAKLWHAALLGADSRNTSIKAMRGLVNRSTTISGARRLLKQQFGYMQRNLIETWMSRLVKLSGGRLKGRSPASWIGQLVGMITILNYHTATGWPERKRRWTPA